MLRSKLSDYLRYSSSSSSCSSKGTTSSDQLLLLVVVGHAGTAGHIQDTDADQAVADMDVA